MNTATIEAPAAAKTKNKVARLLESGARFGGLPGPVLGEAEFVKF